MNGLDVGEWLAPGLWGQANPGSRPSTGRSYRVAAGGTGTAN